MLPSSANETIFPRESLFGIGIMLSRRRLADVGEPVSDGASMLSASSTTAPIPFYMWILSLWHFLIVLRTKRHSSHASAKCLSSPMLHPLMIWRSTPCCTKSGFCPVPSRSGGAFDSFADRKLFCRSSDAQWQVVGVSRMGMVYSSVDGCDILAANT